ncbi:GCN5-related N-acetyltransferase [Arthrobacter sp. RHLT1-20]
MNRRATNADAGTHRKSRPDAHRFYERLGFAARHEGMKIIL